MTKFVSILFRVIGIILLACTILVILSGGLGFDYLVLLLLLDGLVGLLLLYMGKSMKRLAKIEDKLGKYILFPEDLRVPQIKCDKCGRSYDNDVSTCPYCDLDEIKKAFITRG